MFKIIMKKSNMSTDLTVQNFFRLIYNSRPVQKDIIIFNVIMSMPYTIGAVYSRNVLR